jgi:hypothetical protein
MPHLRRSGKRGFEYLATMAKYTKVVTAKDFYKHLYKHLPHLVRLHGILSVNGTLIGYLYMQEEFVKRLKTESAIG